MTSPIRILQAGVLPDSSVAALRQKFDVVPFDEATAAGDIRGLAVRKTKVDVTFLDKFPALEVISSYSAGLENIDLDAVRARGIPVHNTSHILSSDVADLGIALAISVTRGIVRGHDFVRNGDWLKGTAPLQRSMRGLKVGILALGHVGLAVARRLEVIGAEVGYFDIAPKSVSYWYFSSPLEMASWADMVFVCCPLTPKTHHLVDAELLRSLGGYLINISRGSIVDEAALLAALDRNEIQGVALDVYEDEPNVPLALRSDPRVVLSPHMGSATFETRERMGLAVVDALSAHFWPAISDSSAGATGVR
jgi:lactate dehydrogenase-like 2-hydroxyacid dehydrogenase